MKKVGAAVLAGIMVLALAGAVAARGFGRRGGDGCRGFGFGNDGPGDRYADRRGNWEGDGPCGMRGRRAHDGDGPCGGRAWSHRGDCEGPCRDLEPRARNGWEIKTADEAKAQVEKWLAWRGNPNIKAGKAVDKGETIEVDIVTKEGSLVDTLIYDKKTGRVRRGW